MIDLLTDGRTDDPEGQTDRPTKRADGPDRWKGRLGRQIDRPTGWTDGRTRPTNWTDEGGTDRPIGRTDGWTGPGRSTEGKTGGRTDSNSVIFFENLLLKNFGKPLCC